VLLAWDRATGKPLSRAIVWQDRRASGICERLSGRAGELRAHYRIAARPVFRRAEKSPGCARTSPPDGVVTTTGHWLLHRLGAGYVTDAANRLSHDAARPWTRLSGRSGRVRRSGSILGHFRASPTAPGVVGEPQCSETRSSGVHRFRSRGSPWTSRQRSNAHGCFRQAMPSAPTETGAFLLVTTGEKAARSNAGPVRVCRLAARR